MDLMLFANQFKNTPREELEDKLLSLYPENFLLVEDDDMGTITFYDYGWHSSVELLKFFRENGIDIQKEINAQREFDAMWADAMRGCF